MAFDALLNFRSTSGGIADAGGQTYVISAANVLNDPGELYTGSVIRDSLTFGWSAADTTCRNRTGSDPRFFGAHTNFTSNLSTFTLILPAAGVYDIRMACGDPDNSGRTVAMEVLDNTTSLFTVSGTTSNSRGFIDAMSVEYLDTAWDAGNTAQRKTFATTTLIMKVGNNAAILTGWIAHMRVTQVVAATPTKPMWPMSFF